MPNHKLSEFQVKKLWSKFNNNNFLGDYININKLELNNNLKDNLVVKIDDGSKRRMKRGLVKLNQNRDQVINWVKEQNTQKNYFVEQMNEVTQEYYVMIRIEDNNDVLYVNKTGGINQLDPLKDAEKYVVNINEKLDLPTNSEENQLNSVLMKLLDFFRYYHITFLEVNPLAITKNGFTPLDFAVLIDDCSFYLFDQEDK